MVVLNIFFNLFSDFSPWISVFPDGDGVGPHTEAARRRRQVRLAQNVSFLIKSLFFCYLECRLVCKGMLFVQIWLE